MTGQELIDWIKEHKAENKEIVVWYDGYTGDYGPGEPCEHDYEKDMQGKVFLE